MDNAVGLEYHRDNSIQGGTGVPLNNHIRLHMLLLHQYQKNMCARPLDYLLLLLEHCQDLIAVFFHPGHTTQLEDLVSECIDFLLELMRHNYKLFYFYKLDKCE